MGSFRNPCHVVKRRFVLEFRLGPILGNALRSHLAWCRIGFVFACKGFVSRCSTQTIPAIPSSTPRTKTPRTSRSATRDAATPPAARMFGAGLPTSPSARPQVSAPAPPVPANPIRRRRTKIQNGKWVRFEILATLSSPRFVLEIRLGHFSRNALRSQPATCRIGFVFARTSFAPRWSSLRQFGVPRVVLAHVSWRNCNCQLHLGDTTILKRRRTKWQFRGMFSRVHASSPARFQSAALS
jgi:hypothetical protein